MECYFFPLFYNNNMQFIIRKKKNKYLKQQFIDIYGIWYLKNKKVKHFKLVLLLPHFVTGCNF